MKTFLQLAAVFLFCAVAAGWCAVADRKRERAPAGPVVDGIEIDAMLAALAEVESGNNPRAVGRLGERSAWQLMPRSWAMHTRVPHRAATEQPALARMIARRHLEWTLGVLRSRHTEISPELVGAAWRWGPGAAHKHVWADSAQRVAALYDERREARRR